MQLLELRANQPGFKTVRFNPQGLSLIVGSRLNPEDTDRSKTYNGVGKSLIIRLVHFCLGCNSITEFEKKLAGWVFELDIQIGGTRYTIARATKAQKVMLLDGQELGLREFQKMMGSFLFDVPPNLSGLSFRSLVSRFIRPFKGSYAKFDKFIPKENPVHELSANAFLLGYDPHLAARKVELKTKLDELNKNQKLAQEDPILNSFFKTGSDRPLDIEVFQLKEEILEMEDNLSAFKIAKDFQDRRDEANQVKNELHALNNKIVVLGNALENIEKSTRLKDDIPLPKVQRLYEEANLFFNDKQLKTLSDVQRFHSKLIARRRERLLNEKSDFQRDLTELKKERSRLQTRLDQLVGYLGQHGALDDYTALSKTLGEKKLLLDKLLMLQGFQNAYLEKKEALKQEMGEETIHTNHYLKDFHPVAERNLSIFRGLSKQLYHNKPGGIEVVNNTGTNKRRFDIKVHIEDDASDGINEVKIFCFDYTLLLAGHHHKMKCLFHDSRLFSDMDPRQRATILKIAGETAGGHGLQYIASINEDMLTGLQSFLSTTEYEAILAGRVLHLTDTAPENKLLGMQIDLEYE